MKQKSLSVSVGVLLTAVALAGCASPRQSGREALPAFRAIGEAFSAVDQVLGCEDEPSGAPIVPMGDGVPLPSEQRLCAENVQIGLYASEDALQESFEMWADSHQGEVHIVRGANWLVIDVTDVATDQPSSWNIERVAEELGGEYSVAGPE